LTVVQDQLGMASNIIFGLIIAVGLVVWLRTHFRRRHARL